MGKRNYYPWGLWILTAMVDEANKKICKVYHVMVRASGCKGIELIIGGHYNIVIPP
jgi:hypothetical protein